ncbi:DinB family protein [Hymenobacter chitinivorans]|uniref:Putative damage-inducible protein DinB n=1 Tax=Hymenobacter chitinivorans DSM 11115 TaxID=1121954 RepID=A0A2M9BSV7_9BACT|nr:DinB family protein [Hymenobacter chitinivorans]PJJ61038.1 putative damage-inducible protein DinB [Hymenobacter chitinivorans DSM 11115]
MLTATLTPLAQALLPELDHELALTRRVLSRLPEAQFGWQPHPKSMTLTVLATHISDLLGGIAMTMQSTELDLEQYDAVNDGPAATLAELLTRLEASGASAAEAISNATTEDFAEPWTLRHGPTVLLSQPRADIVRHLLSHLIHHRGQLSVYLRLLEVPVPYIYGPSADEATNPG